MSIGADKQTDNFFPLVSRFHRAIFHIGKTPAFWLCLLVIVVAALIPRFVVKVLYQYYAPCDIQIAREAEKFGNLRDHGAVEIEMNPILEPPRR